MPGCKLDSETHQESFAFAPSPVRCAANSELEPYVVDEAFQMCK